MVPTGSGLAEITRRSAGVGVFDHRVSPSPWFSVSVASKGLRVCVSGLESTLAGISISVDSKRARGGMISHRSEDRPLQVEPEPVAVQVAGRRGYGRGFGGRNCGRPFA